MTDNSTSNDEQNILNNDKIKEEDGALQEDGVILKPKAKKNAKQKYLISPRIKQLATPRQMDPSTKKDLLYVPSQIKKADLRYEASRRIRNLAKPVVRAEQTVRSESVFQVKKSALKAHCSPRLQELAKPVHRSTSPFPTFRFYPDLEQNSKKIATIKNINGLKLTRSTTVKPTKTKTAILAK